MIAPKYHLEMAWECLAAAETATTPERRRALLEMAMLYRQTARQQKDTTVPSPDRPKLESLVEFIVKYEEGPLALMAIDKHTLRKGDHVALLIAQQRQRDGTLPVGVIKEVRRRP